jgi:enolase
MSGSVQRAPKARDFLMAVSIALVKASKVTGLRKYAAALYAMHLPCPHMIMIVGHEDQGAFGARLGERA